VYFGREVRPFSGRCRFSRRSKGGVSRRRGVIARAAYFMGNEGRVHGVSGSRRVGIEPRARTLIRKARIRVLHVQGRFHGRILVVAAAACTGRVAPTGGRVAPGGKTEDRGSGSKSWEDSGAGGSEANPLFHLTLDHRKRKRVALNAVVRSRWLHAETPALNPGRHGRRWSLEGSGHAPDAVHRACGHEHVQEPGHTRAARH
jgi:hypothetical protein